MVEYVTGANGFIGQHLLDRLGNFITIPHDEIADYNLTPYSKFFFLSTYGNMAFHQDDGKVLQANVEDLVSVIRKSNFANIDSFVYLSSSSVKLPVQTMYSRTKRAAEEILLSFMEKYNAPILIIRPYSVTGIGEQKEHLIPTLIRSCIDAVPMDFVPEPRHDFIDVEDLVDGIMFLSDRKVKGIFEIGTGESHSNEEVKNIVEQVTGRKAQINKVRSMRNYDATEWVATSSKLKDMGWQPKKTLEQSVKEMTKVYLKEHPYGDPTYPASSDPGKYEQTRKYVK